MIFHSVSVEAFVLPAFFVFSKISKKVEFLTCKTGHFSFRYIEGKVSCAKIRDDTEFCMI